MYDTKIILVTGMSGAGKTTAMKYLEDMGYNCIDKFPSELISELTDLIRNSKDDMYKNLAFSVGIQDYQYIYKYFESRGLNVCGLVLDASDSSILRRYKFTRRTHPLIMKNIASTLEEAIEQERDVIEKLPYADTFVIDTTNLSSKDLGELIESHYMIGNLERFSITFMSFGYKYGNPVDADIMLDVRFLPNPYWEEELRSLTGNDKEVYEYVINAKETQEFIKKFTSFLDYVLPEYEKNGKYHLTIGIGCTGGQHRSVSIVNYLYNHYKEEYNCHKSHRDIKN